MLKDLFSLVTIVALLFSSCSKSDEEENSDEPQPTKQTAYFGVNLSGAEFGNVYPGVDGTHYGYPTEKDLDYFKAKGLYLVRFPFSLGTYTTHNEWGIKCNRAGKNEEIRQSR